MEGTGGEVETLPQLVTSHRISLKFILHSTRQQQICH